MIQQQQSRAVLGLRMNAHFQSQLLDMNGEARSAAAFEVRKRLSDMQLGRKVGYIVKVIRRDKLAGDHIAVVNLGGFSNQAAAKRAFLQLAHHVKARRDPGDNIVYQLFNSYSSVVPLLSEGGTAEGKTLVLDMAVPLEPFLMDGNVPAVAVLLHSLYGEKGLFDSRLSKALSLSNSSSPAHQSRL
jgi:hypothetical protein